MLLRLLAIFSMRCVSKASLNNEPESAVQRKETTRQSKGPSNCKWHFADMRLAQRVLSQDHTKDNKQSNRKRNRPPRAQKGLPRNGLRYSYLNVLHCNGSVVCRGLLHMVHHLAGMTHRPKNDTHSPGGEAQPYGLLLPRCRTMQPPFGMPLG